MNYLQQQLLSEGFKIQEEATTILTEEEENEIKNLEIKNPKDINKIKNPKTKRKIAARLIGAVSLAASIPTAKAASMLAKNSDATRDLFAAQTTIDLSKKAVRELSEDGNLKNLFGNLGTKIIKKTSEEMRDNNSFSDDKFAMWTSGLVGKLASSILRIKNLFTVGDGSAVYSLDDSLKFLGDSLKSLSEDLSDDATAKLSNKKLKNIKEEVNYFNY